MERVLDRSKLLGRRLSNYSGKHAKLRACTVQLSLCTAPWGAVAVPSPFRPRMLAAPLLGFSLLQLSGTSYCHSLAVAMVTCPLSMNLLICGSLPAAFPLGPSHWTEGAPCQRFFQMLGGPT